MIIRDALRYRIKEYRIQTGGTAAGKILTCVFGGFGDALFCGQDPAFGCGELPWHMLGETLALEVCMAKMPSSVAEFLSGRRFAVAGVSRDPRQTANFIYRKLRTSGFEVFPVNPCATEVEGVRCYPNLASVPGSLDGVVAVTHPKDALEVVNQCRQCDVRRVWLHRAFGAGSVSGDAVHACSALGIQCIVGGCPMMYCEPVDVGHRCVRWLLRLGGKIPA